MTKEEVREHGHRIWQIASAIDRMDEDALLYELSSLTKEMKEIALALGHADEPSEMLR